MRTLEEMGISESTISGDGNVSKSELRIIMRSIMEQLDISTIREGVKVSGNTMATCQTYLGVGINIVESASASLNAVKLPYPPKKGSTVIVINNSGFPIAVYPSVEGGSINGTINGSAIVPSDGKPYSFFCWENPLPGAWTWTPPATNQYDSGEIIINTTSGNNVWALLNTNMKGVGSGFNSDTGWGYDCLNTIMFGAGAGANGYVAMQRPNPTWNNLLKLKVYTNLLTDFGGATMGLTQGSTVNLYVAGTTNLVGVAAGGGAGNYGNGGTVPNYFDLNSNVPGTGVGGTLSANIGDPGTLYTVRDYSLMPSYLGSGFGNIYMGQTTYNSILCDKWVGRGAQFHIQPRAAYTGLKLRFFIEYN
jgi:hypothetical protein